MKLEKGEEKIKMALNSRELNEEGYALCGVCRKKLSVGELVDQCNFCGKWFCPDCARETPAGHGSGLICKRCYMRLKK